MTDAASMTDFAPPYAAGETAGRLDDLQAVLAHIGAGAIAVSGGVDSMTLATVAGRTRPGSFVMVHAVSAAVPSSATGRVRRHARREGWRLRVVEAGEFADADYRRNPVDRCFYCKSALYRTLDGLTDGVVCSGTNLDDLGDYRPGLAAAAERGVRHPLVEAGIDKAGVRAIARRLALDDLAELPASPCLSSRVETGIGIDPDTLRLVDAMERWVRRRFGIETVRCRVRQSGVVVEVDAPDLDKLAPDDRHTIGQTVAGRLRAAGYDGAVSVAAYRRGSAFVGGRTR